MKSKDNCSRRDLLKAVGAFGAAAVAGKVALGQTSQAASTPAASTPAGSAPATTAPAMGAMPTRTFGKSGVQVPVLALGGIFDIVNNQVVLHQALKWGVTYWDTANSYSNGNSERGIGSFLGANPQRRKDIFLVTKSGSKGDAAGLDAHLATSLEQMKTDHIDLFFIHGVKGSGEFEQHAAMWKEWAKRQKDAGKIRLFGFSTHSKMEDALQAAAKADFIDGIMLTYNYRLMDKPAMKAAVEACAKAGIGLTAMKTQAGRSKEQPDPVELEMVNQFLAKGYTDKQAALKAVWENPAIASICSQMPNLTILQSNVQAATDGVKLSSQDRLMLQQYAAATCGTYCTACSACQKLTGLPVPDVMRYLMYATSYGDLGRARQGFAQLPTAARQLLGQTDYSSAQARCPAGLPIAGLMERACRELA